MLGLPLAYEMALVAALACLVSWLTGRALCKSKEYEERAAKQSLQTAKDHLDALLAQKDGELQQWAERLRTEQQATAGLQHQYDAAVAELGRLQPEHQASLGEIQALGSYRTRFETLQQVHEGQAQQFVHLQEALQQGQRDMQQAMASAGQRQASLQAEIQALLADKQADSARIQALQNALAAQEQQQQALARDAQGQDGLIAQLRQQNAALQAANSQQQATIGALNAKLEGYLQSVTANNQRISSLLERM